MKHQIPLNALDNYSFRYAYAASDGKGSNRKRLEVSVQGLTVHYVVSVNGDDVFTSQNAAEAIDQYNVI